MLQGYTISQVVINDHYYTLSIIDQTEPTSGSEMTDSESYSPCELLSELISDSITDSRTLVRGAKNPLQIIIKLVFV